MGKTLPLDYSKKEYWYKLLEITNEVDTFYIYATEYILGSFEPGAPEFAPIDNEEMREKDHPEYYSRMLAAYTIGYSVTKSYLAANPHLKFATGETDSGVIIAFNTEGPKNVELKAHHVVVLLETMSINPLNWKLDETYAPASMNLGSIILDDATGERSIGDMEAATPMTTCTTSTTSRPTLPSALTLIRKTNSKCI